MTSDDYSPAILVIPSTPPASHFLSSSTTSPSFGGSQDDDDDDDDDGGGGSYEARASERSPRQLTTTQTQIQIQQNPLLALALTENGNGPAHPALRHLALGRSSQESLRAGPAANPASSSCSAPASYPAASPYPAPFPSSAPAPAQAQAQAPAFGSAPPHVSTSGSTSASVPVPVSLSAADPLALGLGLGSASASASANNSTFFTPISDNRSSSRSSSGLITPPDSELPGSSSEPWSRSRSISRSRSPSPNLRPLKLSEKATVPPIQTLRTPAQLASIGFPEKEWKSAHRHAQAYVQGYAQAQAQGQQELEQGRYREIPLRRGSAREGQAHGSTAAGNGNGASDMGARSVLRGLDLRHHHQQQQQSARRQRPGSSPPVDSPPSFGREHLEPPRQATLNRRSSEPASLFQKQSEGQQGGMTMTSGTSTPAIAVTAGSPMLGPGLPPSGSQSSLSTSRVLGNGVASSGSGPLRTPTGDDSRIRTPAASRAPSSSLTAHDNASESWTNPEDADGALVRRTYAHFAREGVPDDGFVDGKEYTRERAGLPPWELPIPPSATSKSALGRSRTFRRDQTRSPSPAGSGSARANGAAELGLGFVEGAGAGNGETSHLRTRTGTAESSAFVPSSSSRPTTSSTSRDSSAAGLEALDSPTSPTSAGAHASSSGGLEPLAAARGGGAGSRVPRSDHSHESALVELGEEEWNRQREEAEKKMDELLSKVDRYGFFSRSLGSSSHGRTELLPAAALRTLPSRKARKVGSKADQDGAAASAPPTPDPSSALSNGHNSNGKSRAADIVDVGRDEDAERTHKAREQSRVTKWGKMLSVTAWDEGRNASSYGLSSGSSKRLRRRVYKGIPDIWRSAAWWALMERRCGTSEGQRSSQKSASGRKDALGRRDYERRYERLLTVGSPHDVQIDLDVPRTISGHILFHTRYGQGQRSLFHVLHAFSLLCPDCAYCQGMGPIAATLLCYFEPERAYASLCRLHNHYDLHGIFSPGFPGLVETFYVQEQLVKMLMPRVARVLEEQMISTSAYATKWYITLFANTVPFETQLRIWDAVLLQGREVLVCVGIAVVWALREGLESEDASFESILATLSSFMVPEDEDGLMDWVAKLMNRKDVRMKIVEARREWEGYVASGEAMQHLL